MSIKLISSTTKNFYLVNIDEVLYNYIEEIGYGDSLLDYQITHSSIIDDTLASREVTDQSIRNKVLRIVNEHEKQNGYGSK
jgi:hypothetical protein